MRHHNVLWFASLSDGNTVYEGKGDYSVIPGQLSPWLRLQEHLNATGTYHLYLTSLGLYTADGQKYLLPPLGKNPSFAPYRKSPVKPISYNMFRQVDAEINQDGQSEKLYTVAEARYEQGTVQLYVDNSTKNSWVNFKPA